MFSYVAVVGKIVDMWRYLSCGFVLVRPVQCLVLVSRMPLVEFYNGSVDFFFSFVNQLSNAGKSFFVV